MSKVLGTREEKRVIDGVERLVVVQTLAPSRNGQSVSNQFFGGRRSRKNKVRAGEVGLRDSAVERQVVR